MSPAGGCGSPSAELAALPRAAIVVEDRFSQLFKTEYARPAQVADALAELQVRWPSVPLVYAETRPLAEEWTYRFLAAAEQWARDEHVIGARVPGVTPETSATAPAAPRPDTPRDISTAEVRAWARQQGIEVPDRGRLRPEVWARYHQAHPDELS